MPRNRDRFEHWLAEWREHTWSRASFREWSQVQLTDTDVQEHTWRILSAASPLHGLDRLANVTKIVREHRDKQKRCLTAIGAEALALHDAGGAWSEIADWTTMNEKSIRALARAPGPKAGPHAHRLGTDLAALVARVPDNPLFRICELLTAARFFESVANELDEVTDWLCFELSDSGASLTQIARCAQIGVLTLSRRINRARHRNRRRG